MSYLADKCTFRMFTPSLIADGAKFVCGDSDLDEFFHEDAFLQEREFRDLKPDKPLNTRLMYFDLIELLN